MTEKLWEVGDVFAATGRAYKGVLWEAVSDDEWVRIKGPGTGRRIPEARLHFNRWASELGMHLHKSAAQIRQESLCNELAEAADYYIGLTGGE